MNANAEEDAAPALDSKDGRIGNPHSVNQTANSNSQDTLVPGSQKKEPEPEPAPEDQPIPKSFYLVYAALCLATFLVGLDANIIATAIPVITSHFNSIDDVGWYGSAFYIALCASQPLAGKMYTLFPKRGVLLCYLLIFEVGSLVCAVSPTSTALIVGRAVAGLGTSGIFAGGLIIVATLIPLHKRPVFVGVINSMFSVASIVGPVIGGALTQHATWRWCFYINLPGGGVAAFVILTMLRMDQAPSERQPLKTKLKSLDGIGFALYGGASTMLVLALEWGGSTYPWKSATIIGLFVGFGVTMAVFIGWQAHMKDFALIPLNIFANRNVDLLILSAMLTIGTFQVIIYWMPIWFQAVLGVSPSDSGVRYLPTVISDVITAVIGSALVTKLGIWNPFVLSGEALLSIGSGLLSTLYAGISDGHWIGYEILVGIGFSLCLTQVFVGVQASSPQASVPIANSVLLTCMSLSCAVFLSIGQIVFKDRLLDGLTPVVGRATAEQILSEGATDIRSLTNPQQLSATISAYSSAVTEVFYIPAGGAALAFLLTLGCKWISTKQPQQPNEQEQKQTEHPADSEKGATV